ncbi:MAG: hypothetical protein AB7L66_10680 [Gemmatimonadales bacterium]
MHQSSRPLVRHVRLSVLLLVAGCAGQPAPREAAVAGLYRTVIRLRLAGAPTAAQLDSLAPYLSSGLRADLDRARRLRETEEQAHPGDKPPFADGDLFSSLFEGPTAIDAVVGADDRFVAHLRDERPTPAVSWTDTVVVVDEGGRPAVDDVRYGGTWDFANRGSLRAALAESAGAPPGAGNVMTLEGLAPVRLGMSIADVEALLGGPVRVDRLEPDAECGYAAFPRMPAGVAYMLAADTIVRIDVDTTAIRTADGVGVGDAEAALLDRFGTRMRVEPHPYEGPVGHYLILDEGAPGVRRFIFETDGARVTRYRVGRRPEVDLIEGCA